MASPEGDTHAVRIHADATLHAGLFDGAEQATLALDPARKAYVHLVRGALRVNGQALRAGDALKVEGEPRLHLDDGRQAQLEVAQHAAAVQLLSRSLAVAHLRAELAKPRCGAAQAGACRRRAARRPRRAA